MSNNTTNTQADTAHALALAELETHDLGLDLAILVALKVTHGARQATYAHPAINFINTALEWTKDAHDYGELDADKIINPYSVARKMVLLKKARMVSAPHRDGLVDAIGYESCMDRIAVFLIQHGFVMQPHPDAKAEWEEAWVRAMTFFDDFTYDQLYVFYRLVMAKLAANSEAATQADLDAYEVAIHQWNTQLRAHAGPSVTLARVDG